LKINFLIYFAKLRIRCNFHIFVKFNAFTTAKKLNINTPEFSNPDLLKFNIFEVFDVKVETAKRNRSGSKKNHYVEKKSMVFYISSKKKP